MSNGTVARAIALAMLAGLVGGCGGGGSEVMLADAGSPAAGNPSSVTNPAPAPVASPPQAAPVATKAKSRVVVGVEGTFNPFHELFRQGGPIYRVNAPSAVTPEVLAQFGIGPDQIIDVPRTGSEAGNFAATADLAARIKPNQHYWFKGTNVIGFFTGAETNARKLISSETGGDRGTIATAYVLAQNPEAIVLFEDSRGAAIALDDGPLLWRHPQVDIVVRPSNTREPPIQHFGHYDSAVTHGKLFFAAVFDQGLPTVAQSIAGPWWSIAIGGFAEKTEGTTTVAGASAYVNGMGMDFIANAHEMYPECAYCERGQLSAMSDNDFAAASAAGAASRALLLLRRAFAHEGGITKPVGGSPLLVATNSLQVTPWQFRRALEQAAKVQAYAVDPSNAEGGNATGLNQAPWLTQGWGLLSTAFDDSLADRVKVSLGLSLGDVITKAIGFCGHQTQFMQQRQAYWNNPSTGVGAVPDPLIYCEGL